MNQASLRARALLPDRDATVAFLMAQQSPGGGFVGRDGHADLYYTMFAIEALAAMGAPVDANPLAGFLAGYADVWRLDMIHLTCLARCWVRAGSPGPRDAMLGRLACFRSGDGGYHAEIGTAAGSAYGAILALGGYQDLDAPLPQPGELLASLDRLRLADGGFTNDVATPVGLAPATAAAAVVQTELGRASDSRAIEWLAARQDVSGGFVAIDGAPMADLLSTATAIHAIAQSPGHLAAVRDGAIAFVHACRLPGGGFAGVIGDGVADCEYTFYALLALGHLAGEP